MTDKQKGPRKHHQPGRVGTLIILGKFLFITVLSVFLAAQGPWNEPGQRNDRNLVDEKSAQFPEIFRFFDSFNKGKQPDPKDAEQIRVLIKEFQVLRLIYGILVQQLEEMVKR